jgi:hypothetical protein
MVCSDSESPSPEFKRGAAEAARRIADMIDTEGFDPWALRRWAARIEAWRDGKWPGPDLPPPLRWGTK